MRILIVKTSSLGDLFHALPAVHLLKQAYAAEVDWVVNPEYTQLVECFTDVDRVIPFPRKKLLSKLISFRRELRAETYDLVVDLQGLLKSALVCRMAKRSDGAKILGPSFHREGAGLFYTDVVGTKNKQRHAVEENLDALSWLDQPQSPIRFPLHFPDVDHAFWKDRPVVVFASCSRHEAKNWPADRFVELGNQLKMQIVLVGTPADAFTCKNIEQGLPRGTTHNLCGKTSLLELGGILQKADLVITVDSGPMHMASATGTPCLAIFGPTDPLRVGPYGDQHGVIRNSTVDGYSKQDLQSILMVEVSDVLAAARKLLTQ